MVIFFVTVFYEEITFYTLIKLNTMISQRFVFFDERYHLPREVRVCPSLVSWIRSCFTISERTLTPSGFFNFSLVFGTDP